MTFANILATGAGKLAARMVIEGLETEWVTDAALAGAGTDGRTRRVGLIGSSFAFSEQADIAKASLQGNGFTARIVDVSETATSEFAKLPTNTTWAYADVERVDTSITVRSTQNFNVGDYIHIGTECMYVSGVTDATHLAVTRAKRDTILQKHYAEDGQDLRSPEITNKQVSIEGRRVYVYLYGDDETGDGTLRYTGICATEARLADAVSWEITVDPISKIFDQSIGQDLATGVKPRGIMYIADYCDLILSVSEGTSDTAGDVFHTAGPFTIYLARDYGTEGVAFYETQEEFCEALNDAIVTAAASLSHPLTAGGSGNTPTLKAVPDASGGWHLEYKTGATARWLNVSLLSDLDVGTIPGPTRLQDGGVDVVQVTANTSYTVPASAIKIDGAGTVPRGVFPGVRRVTSSESPPSRHYPIYLGGSVVPDGTLTSAKIEFPDAFPSGAETLNMEIRTTDSTDRWIEVSGVSGEAPPNCHYWTSTTLPTITFGRTFVVGNLWDFIEEITTAAPDDANDGSVPFIVAGTDINATDAAATIDELTNGSPFMARRSYGQFKPMKIMDVIAPELTLMGAIMSSDSSGRVTFRKIRAVAATEDVDGTIDPSTQLAFPSWERNAFGAVNTIEVLTGWDPQDDSYRGRTFVVRDVGALSRNKTARKLTIKPKSFLNSDSDSGVTETDILNLTAPIIGLLGYPYDVITVKVPLTLFEVFIGDSVTIESDQLPNASTGARGVSSQSGIVIGRKWSPFEGNGELTILATLQNLAGYTPTSRIISNANVAGFQYDLTITAASQPSGYASVSKWNVGDAVKVTQLDNASPTVRVGTIDSINTGAEKLRVTLDAAIPAGTLNVDYGETADVQYSQQVYCFIADDAATLNYTSSTTPARTLSP